MANPKDDVDVKLWRPLWHKLDHRWLMSLGLRKLCKNWIQSSYRLLISSRESRTQTQMFWFGRHSLPFCTPCVASHKRPTFSDPVPNGPRRKRLWCTWVVCLFDSGVLQPTCQNCWFTITFAEEDQFWNRCHTSTNGLLFKHGALLHSYLSSRHPGLLQTRDLRGFFLCRVALVSHRSV